MKVPLQISIEHLLRERLKELSAETGIPVSRIITDLLERHLDEIEARLGLHPRLPLR